MKTSVLLLLIIHSVISCTSVSTAPEIVKINTSIITTRYSSEYLPANAIFKWAPSQNKFYDDERLAKVGMDELIKASIISELRNKGYLFEPEADVSVIHFQVGYVAGLTSSLADSRIEKDYGLYPGLPDSKQNTVEKEKGTVIVSIYNPNNGQVIWRGAGQAFTVLKEIPQGESTTSDGLYAKNVCKFSLK